MNYQRLIQHYLVFLKDFYDLSIQAFGTIYLRNLFQLTVLLQQLTETNQYLNLKRLKKHVVKLSFFKIFFAVKLSEVNLSFL